MCEFSVTHQIFIEQISCIPYVFLDEIYTSEKHGSDEHGDGTEQKPFKTILQAMRHAGKEPFPVIYTDAKEGGKEYYFIFVYELYSS